MGKGPETEDRESAVVLVVDDDTLVARSLCRVRSRAGYRAESCVGGAGCAEAVARLNPDLVLLDLRMPDVDGWQVLEQLAANPSPPLVMVCSSETNREAARRHSFVVDVLRKPLGPAVLVAAVSAV